MKVHNFQGYLKSKVSNRLLEEEDCGSYGANPEEEMENDSDMSAEDEFDLAGDLEGDLEGEESEEEVEEVTLEDLKAMLDDISSRVSALEGDEEGMEEEEGEEGEEDIEDEDVEDEDVEEEEEA
jgi:hypothetical protein